MSDASGGCAVTLFYWVGPETVNSFRLDSFLPSLVQMAPWAPQSVVAGSSMVTSPVPCGFTVMRQGMLLGWSVRCSLATVGAGGRPSGALNQGLTNTLAGKPSPYPVMAAT